MSDNALLRQLRNAVIVAIVLVVLVAAGSFLQLVALAILLSFILTPVANAFERWRLPRAAAGVVTIALALGATGVLGYIVLAQVGALADDLPRYEENIMKKVESVRGLANSPFSKVTEVAERLQERLEPSKPTEEVEIVRRASPLDRIQELVTPAAHLGETAFIVLFLVLLLLLEREQLAQRLIKLGGRGHVSVTTKTITQIGARLSRYLASFSLVNLVTGILVGAGLWLIGLPYAVLWGVLGAVLRYIPFVGPTLAFALPVVFSIAHFDNLHQPALVIGWYLIIEVATNILEPYLYGKSTGISAVGLFISAIMWTWMWGPLGLLMATPLTVCLVVLGKSVPSLGFLATLLSDDIAISVDERLYQRIVRVDHDAAIALLDEQLESTPVEVVFDTTLVPMLARARRDLETGILTHEEWDTTEAVLTDWLSDLSTRKELQSQFDLADEARERIRRGSPVLVGVATGDGPDEFALKMLNVLLQPVGAQAIQVQSHASPLVLGESIASEKPDCVVLSHLPWDGLTRIRYITKRLQATLESTPLIVGVWDSTLDRVKVNDAIRPSGTGRVALTLQGARDFVVEWLEQTTSTNEPIAVAAHA